MKTKIRFLIISLILMVTATGLVNNFFRSETDSCFMGLTQVIPSGSSNIVGLADTGTCGVTNYKGDSIDYEGFAGLKVHTANANVEYTMYTHSNCYDKGTVSIQRNGLGDTMIKLGSISVNETKSFDIKDIATKMNCDETTGLYRLTIMTGKDEDEPASMYLYYDGKNVHYCRYSRHCRNDIEKWNQVVASLNPEKCLDMWVGNSSNPITYPTSGTNGSCNHVKEWCDLSDEIVLHDEWTDEAKVFAMILYLTRNYAYDDYRVTTLNNTSRAMKDDAWTDDGHFMFYNHVGQCWDAANALTIMCRHHGIPCTSVENDYHTVNAVWLRDEWVAIDVSALMQNHCKQKDTNPDDWMHYRDSSYAYSYGYYDSTMNTYNQALATPETTLSNRSGKNPM